MLLRYSDPRSAPMSGDWYAEDIWHKICAQDVSGGIVGRDVEEV